MRDRPTPTEAEILAYQAEVERFYPADAVAAPIDRQRRWYDDLCRAFDAPVPEGLEFRDRATPRPGGMVPYREYVPAGGQHTVLVVYIHGGGFVVGGLDSHHAVCAELAAATGTALVSVDYRLAPEHRYPAALTDCLSVLLAFADRPLLVAGDSAGGNLAAGAALVLRDAARGVPAAVDLLAAAGWDGTGRLPRLVGQALVYPELGGDLVSGSCVEMAEAPGLTTTDVRYYRDLHGAPPDDPYAAPLQAPDLSGLPAAYVTAPFFDPLRDDGRRYAAALCSAGVTVAYREEPQMIHGWLRARHRSPGAKHGFAALCRGLRALIEDT